MKGYSKRYSTVVGWRDLAILLGTLGEDENVHISWAVEPCGLVPFSVRVTARAYRGGDAFMQTLPVAISRATLGAKNIESIFTKFYWLVWDIAQQLANARAAQSPDEGREPLPLVG